VLRQVRDRAVMERLLLTITEGSLCGFGQRLARPLHDLLNAFGDEVLR
jgi:NADH:ubiquinone oxidoreductase subunit F (NADH-binding)